MSEYLVPQERIRKQSDFSLIYRKGNRYRKKYLDFVYLANDLSFSRLAVIASKKVGNAVARNKVKRWIRTLFRRNKELLKDTLDLIIIAKPNILEASWKLLQQDYLNALEGINQKNQTG